MLTIAEGGKVCSGALYISQAGAGLEPELKQLWAQLIPGAVRQGAEPCAVCRRAPADAKLVGKE